MTITNIYTKTLKAELKNPFITSLRRVDMLEDLVVFIECSDGSIGYGEGAATPVITGETFGSMVSAIEHIKTHIMGLPIADFNTILNLVHTSIVKNTTAKSALEMALYDLKAKSKKLPLYAMLGGSKKEFRTDITISMDSVETMVQNSLNAISLGYNSLKIKIGDNSKKDFERIVAIHQSIDSNISLRLDANQGWSAKQSVELLLALESKGIIAEFIEQPVLADDIEGLLYIKQRVQTPILADESIFSLKDAKVLLDMQAIDYVNIKLAKTAGITQALKLADLSASYGVKCMIGCMLEGPIAVSAGVHLASAKADIITMIDLDAVSLLASHPVKTNIVFDESYIKLSDDIGLGASYTPTIN
jgi:o-succinylbenzoate synthase